MNSAHVSEADLQQYLSDRLSCSAETITHIEGCGVCRVAMENYRLLFSELAAMPKPAPDFDVTALVMSKLPQAFPDPGTATPEPARIRLPYYLLVMIAAAVPLYLFRQNMQVLFTEVPSLFVFMMVGVAFLVLFFMLYAMNRQYRRRFEELI